MNISVDVDIKDYAKEFAEQKDEVVLKALEMCGFEMEKYAKGLSNADTGLQRNSITYAIDGEVPHIGEYSADNPDAQGQIKSGGYSGAAPKEDDSMRSVSIGTNVEYAIYNEVGGSKRLAANDGRGFLRPAIEDNADKYRNIIEQCMKGEI